MGWNPLESSLFTGAGTPWGATESAKPSSNPFEGVNMDPNAYQGFDRSGLKAAMMRNIAKRGMRSQAQALAGLQKAGVRGADTSRAISDLAAAQGEQTGNIEAEMAYKDWQDRMAERDRALALAQQQWAAQNANYQQEQQGRQGFYGALASSLPYLALL